MELCWETIGEALMNNKLFYVVAYKVVGRAPYCASRAYTRKHEAVSKYNVERRLKNTLHTKLFRVVNGRYELIEEYKA